MLRSPGHLTVFHPKRQVGVLVKEGVGHGLLSDEQSALVERVLALATRRVVDEMVPWAKVLKVSINDPPKRLWDLANRSSVSRYPVVDPAGKVRGVVSVYDALRHGRDQCPPIVELMHPVERLPRTMPSREGLSRLQTSHVAMAVVVDGEKPLGIVTVKDLVEPITGELASW
jgi:CBS domain containing-hemolysin-like protein